MSTYSFDRNYRNTEQVAPFLDAFVVVFDEIVSNGAFTYNDSFKGRISGIAGPDEDTAIYLLQKLKRQRDIDLKVIEYLADGFEHIESVSKITRFARVVHYDFYSGGTGWQEWTNARLVPRTTPDGAAYLGGIKALLPKGKRINGYLISGKVLVKR